LEKKDKDGKYLDDANLTDDEITNTLYEIAIGKKPLASQKKEDSSQAPSSPSDTTEKGHWDKYM